MNRFMGQEPIEVASAQITGFGAEMNIGAEGVGARPHLPSRFSRSRAAMHPHLAEIVREPVFQ